MKIARAPDDLRGFPEGFVATVGNFDGVHAGHRRIISSVTARADELGCSSLVITFEPHPATVLYPARGFSALTSVGKKMELIKGCGAGFALLMDFTLAFSQKGPRQFVEETLLPIRVRELYVGHDFSFGAGRRGNVSALAKEGKTLGFAVYEMEEVAMNGENVRSSRIRELLSLGDVEKAALFLARPHSVSGVVVKGAGRGRSLGFPTCNLGAVSEMVPGAGVYATRTLWNGELRDSATHVGVIPTFDVDVPGIETHIFGFDREIIGDAVEIRFHKKLRDAEKFRSAEELGRRIALDCENARHALEGGR